MTREPIHIIDVAKNSAYMSYRAAIKLVSDWQTLGELANDFTHNDKLSDDEKDDLVRLANAKELELRTDLFRVRFQEKDS